MASISKRLAPAGHARYDIRDRAGRRAAEEAFKRRHDATLTGPIADPRRGRDPLIDFANRWLETRLVQRKPVGLPKVVAEALEKHLANYGQPGEAGVLFTGPRGAPITRALLSKEWQAARMAADAPEGLRIHDLRHHAATLTARMPGITTKELMDRIGHASPRAGLIYQHATEQRDREIAAFLDEAISEP
jgi:integrase